MRRKYTEAQRNRIRDLEAHRNRLHYELGWPWREIPTAKATFLAEEELYATEPYVRYSPNPFREVHMKMIYAPEKVAGMGEDAEIFKTQPCLMFPEDESREESMQFCESCGIDDSTVEEQGGELLCDKCRE